jgi:hypothetical protein
MYLTFLPRTPSPLLPLLALLLAACGGGGGDSAPSDGTSTSTSASASGGSVPADSGGTTAGAGTASGGNTTASGSTAPAGTTTTAGGTGTGGSTTGGGTTGGSTTGGSTTDGSAPAQATFDDSLPAAGHPGGCAVPAEAQAEDVSSPRTVVGTGTPESCTSAAFVSAVAKGGVITFNCGNAPVTITVAETAKVVNDSGPKIVIDGGGKVTLSGGGQRRILYMNTCDPAQGWTTSHCQNQDHPQLTLQNLTFVDGSASGTNAAGADGGGAVFARGGRLKIVNSRFFRNQCDASGPDVGGAAVRAFDQYNGLPLHVVNSTFGGRSDLANVCSNGGGLSSIGVSYNVVNSLLTHNRAIGTGANPARPGTPGGGSGGAIYNDGNTFDLRVCGSRITDNSANEGGGAIFFVSNDLTGTLGIANSVLGANPDRFRTAGFPGIFFLGSGTPQVSGSTVQP